MIRRTLCKAFSKTKERDKWRGQKHKRDKGTKGQIARERENETPQPPDPLQPRNPAAALVRPCLTFKERELECQK